MSADWRTWGLVGVRAAEAVAGSDVNVVWPDCVVQSSAELFTVQRLSLVCLQLRAGPDTARRCPGLTVCTARHSQAHV